MRPPRGEDPWLYEHTYVRFRCQVCMICGEEVGRTNLEFGYWVEFDDEWVQLTPLIRLFQTIAFWRLDFLTYIWQIWGGGATGEHMFGKPI